MDNTDKDLKLVSSKWPKSIPRLGQSPTSETPQTGLKNSLGLITPLLAAAGLLTYGILSIGYERFYSPLGVDPADAGFNYTNILAHSVGFVVAVLVIPVALTAYLLLSLGLLIVTSRRDPRYGTKVLRRYRRRQFLKPRLYLSVMRLYGVIGLLTLAGFIFFQTPSMSTRVQEGLHVEPLTVGPITLFAVRADPVTVKAINPPRVAVDRKESQPTAKDYLAELTNSQDLLYLGQTNGIAVIYDAENERTIRLAMSSVMLEVES